MTYKAFKHLTVGVLLTGTLLLGSCTKEAAGRGEPAPGPREGDGYLSFNIDVKDLPTAARNGETDDGDDGENQVNSVRVILYDTAADPEVKYAFHFNISTNDFNMFPAIPYDWYTDGGLYAPDGNGGRALYGNLPGEEDPRLNRGRFLTYAQKVARQDYQMLVIVNPTYFPGLQTYQTVDEMEQDGTVGALNLYHLTRKGARLSEFNTAFEIEQSEISSPKSIACNRGMNVSESNFVMTNSQGLIPIPEATMPATLEDAHASPYVVRVDRVAAKIRVVTPSDGIKLTDNAAYDQREMSFAPDVANRWGYWMRRMTYLKGAYPFGQEETVADTDRAMHYAEDPNFDGLYQGHSYEINFQTVDQMSAFQYSVNSLTGDQDLYVLENTLTPAEQGEIPARYTRVVVRLRYTPDQTRMPLTGISPGYYTYDHIAYTRDEIKRFHQNLSDPDYPFPVGLREAMLQASAEHGLEFDRTDSHTPGFTSHGINYYSDCVNYFTVPIRHFDIPSFEGLIDYAAYGRFGVVRNNVYTITLNSLQGPGSPTVENPAYISAGVRIQPWGRLAQAVELGEETPVIESRLVTYNYYYEDSNGNRHLFHTAYDDTVTEGSAIPFSDAIRDAQLEDVPVGGRFVLVWHNWTAVRTVTSDPGQNVVHIVYGPE